MIKFFRHIRQTLIMENKTSKYFKYAIGEIILVVIGILIALQINNWNEELDEKKIELTYMQNLLEDLNKDIQTYKEFQKSNTTIYNLIDSIIPNIKGPNRKLHVSKLSFWTRMVTIEWNIINPVQKTFEEMKSSGHLRLIKNKDVAHAISDYYNSLTEFDGYREAGMLWAHDYVQTMGKLFDGELLLKIMREKEMQEAKPSDLLSEDPLVINELISSLQYFNGALVLGEAVSAKEKEKAKNLIQLIKANYFIK
jgi:predicted HTH domain antitoxin